MDLLVVDYLNLQQLHYHRYHRHRHQTHRGFHLYQVNLKLFLQRHLLQM